MRYSMCQCCEGAVAATFSFSGQAETKRLFGHEAEAPFGHEAPCGHESRFVGSHVTLAELKVTGSGTSTTPVPPCIRPASSGVRGVLHSNSLEGWGDGTGVNLKQSKHALVDTRGGVIVEGNNDTYRMILEGKRGGEHMRKRESGNMS